MVTKKSARFVGVIHWLIRNYLKRTCWPRDAKQLQFSRNIRYLAPICNATVTSKFILQKKVVKLQNCLLHEYYALERKNKTFTNEEAEEGGDVESIHEKKERAILYIHGGAFCLNTPNIYEPFLKALAKRIDCTIFAPGYRKSPENVWPCALEDCLEAYRYLLEERQIDPKRIIISGDSAGGNLSITTTMQILKEGKLPPPAGIVGFSAWLDLSMRGSSYEFNESNEPYLTLKSIERAAWMYLNGNFNFNKFDESVRNRLKEFCIEKGMPYVYSSEEEKYKKRLKEPFVSPVYFDENAKYMDKFPPVFLHAAREELLLSDSLIFARRLNQLSKSRMEIETTAGGEDESCSEANQSDMLDASNEQYSTLEARQEDKKESFSRLGGLGKECIAALETQGSTFADGCNPADGKHIKASVIIWNRQYHAFPAFIALDRKNVKRCVEATSQWISELLKN